MSLSSPRTRRRIVWSGRVQVCIVTILAGGPAEDLGVEEALLVLPLPDHDVAVGGVLEPHVLDAPSPLVAEPHRRVEARLYVGQHGVVRVALHDLEPRVLGGHVEGRGDLAEPAAVGEADAAV